jgi:hypothetical protein
MENVFSSNKQELLSFEYRQKKDRIVLKKRVEARSCCVFVNLAVVVEVVSLSQAEWNQEFPDRKEPGHLHNWIEADWILILKISNNAKLRLGCQHIQARKMLEFHPLLLASLLIVCIKGCIGWRTWRTQWTSFWAKDEEEEESKLLFKLRFSIELRQKEYQKRGLEEKYRKCAHNSNIMQIVVPMQRETGVLRGDWRAMRRESSVHQSKAGEIKADAWLRFIALLCRLCHRWGMFVSG